MELVVENPDSVSNNSMTKASPIINLKYWIPLDPDPSLEIKIPKKTNISLKDLQSSVQPMLTLTSSEPTITSAIQASTTSTTTATVKTSSELELDELSFPEDNSSRSPSKEDSLQDRQDSNCYVQTCDQTITGRQLAYQRALDIVQGEEYLEAADTDIIRRQFIVKPKLSVHQR